MLILTTCVKEMKNVLSVVGNGTRFNSNALCYDSRLVFILSSVSIVLEVYGIEELLENEMCR